MLFTLRIILKSVQAIEAPNDSQRRALRHIFRGWLDSVIARR